MYKHIFAHNRVMARQGTQQLGIQDIVKIILKMLDLHGNRSSRETPNGHFSEKNVLLSAQKICGPAC